MIAIVIVRQTVKEIFVVVPNDDVHRRVEVVRAVVYQEVGLRGYERLQSTKALLEHSREF